MSQAAATHKGGVGMRLVLAPCMVAVRMGDGDFLSVLDQSLGLSQP